MQRKRNFRHVLLFIICALFLSACETVSYYHQAASGQFALLWGREPIAALLQDLTLDQQTRQKLMLVLSAREFAQDELFLPDGDSYSQFVELEREYVVWNVFAAPEFSSAPLTWCYPIAGCVAYRGYFSESAAQEYAQKLSSQGYDVYTGGVDAYSTLGWFNDPLTSSVLRRSERQLAGLVFHELAHQIVYLAGDTTFNESFASFVENEGLRRWMQKNPQVDVDVDLQQEQARQEQFVALVSDFRDRFSELYKTDLSPSRMRADKLVLQNELRENYEALSRDWGSRAYERWFAGPLNNAQLATVSSYNDLVPAFAAMLGANENKLQDFYEQVKTLAGLPKDERDARLSDYRTKALSDSL